MDPIIKIITILLLWAAGLVAAGIITRTMVTLFCYGYGC